MVKVGYVFTKRHRLASKLFWAKENLKAICASHGTTIDEYLRHPNRFPLVTDELELHKKASEPRHAPPSRLEERLRQANKYRPTRADLAHKNMRLREKGLAHLIPLPRYNPNQERETNR